MVSPFDLSQTLLISGGLLVPCSLWGPPVITQTDDYYGAWPGWVISVSVLLLTVLFSSFPQSFPASRFFPMSWLFTSRDQRIGTSALVSVPPMNIQGWFPLDWLIWSPCNPRDSQESSSAPQFKSINSVAPSLLYGPTLTFINDYWKNHSFDWTDLCWWSTVSSF